MAGIIGESAHQILVRDGRKANPSDALKINHKFNESRLKTVIDSKILDFLHCNRDLLPMFASPGAPSHDI